MLAFTVGLLGDLAAELSCLLAIEAAEAYEPALHGVVVGIDVTAGFGPMVGFLGTFDSGSSWST